MTPRLLGAYAPDSPEWHQARATRIGGSHIATIMGWSPFETRADLLARMQGVAEPKPRTKAMDRGHVYAAAVVVELQPVAERAPHADSVRNRKPPCSS